MNNIDRTDAVAVLAEKQGQAAENVRAYLDAQSLAPAHWYHPTDLDHLDEAVRWGRIHRVVFPELPTLLMGIWDGRITFEHWLSNGIRLDFVSLPAAASESLIRLIFESWRSWRRRHRRRQAIAGAILSAIIILTVFLFVTWLSSMVD